MAATRDSCALAKGVTGVRRDGVDPDAVLLAGFPGPFLGGYASVSAKAEAAAGPGLAAINSMCAGVLVTIHTKAADPGRGLAPGR